MENETFPHLLAEDDIGLVVDANETALLEDTMKWGRFFVVGTVIAGGLFVLLLLLMVAMGYNIMRILPRGKEAILLIWLLSALIATVMLVFLMRFCIFCRRAIDNEDVATFNKALAALQYYFITSGIVSMLYLFFLLVKYAAG